MAGGRRVHRASAGHPGGSRRGGSHLDGTYSTATATYQSHGRTTRPTTYDDEAGSEGGLTDIGVVGQRIRVPRREILWVLAVLQEVLPERGIRAPQLQKRMSPVGGVRRPAQQEGLRLADQPGHEGFTARLPRRKERLESANLPTDRPAPRYAGAVGPGVPDGSLQISQTRAVPERLLPSRASGQSKGGLC